jgi:hypothetical protein
MVRADGVVDLSQTEIQIDVEWEVPESRSNGEGVLTGGDGVVIVACRKEINGPTKS